MRFQPDSLPGTHTITRHEPGALWIDGARWGHSVLVPWRGDIRPWPLDRLSLLAATHFEQVLSMQPALVIFGSGDRLQFVSPALYRCLIEARIGVETMDTGAACRTFNVLASEGRSVVAALLVPGTP